MTDDIRSKKEIVYTADGVTEYLDMPEFQARGLHNFRDWICNIGQYILHINYQGEMFFGTCRVRGKVGNYFEDHATHKTRPKQWALCERDWCYCGAEIKQHKVSPDGKQRVGPTVDDCHVIWDLSRWCNFDCSYCPPTVHNSHEGHHSLETLKGMVDYAEAYFEGTKGIQFSLSGGEPTFDPSIVELCKYIRERGHYAHVQSNGSRGRKFWDAFVPHVTSLTISIHFEYLSEARLYRSVEAILSNLREGSVLEVKMIAQEENMERVRAIRDTLLANPAFQRRARLAVMPVSDFNVEEKTRTPRTYEQTVEFKYT